MDWSARGLKTTLLILAVAAGAGFPAASPAAFPVASPAASDVASPATSQVASPDSVLAILQGWMGQIPLDARVLSSVDYFALERSRQFPSGYAEAVSRTLRDEILRRTEAQVRKAVTSTCEPFIDVEYPGSGLLDDAGEIGSNGTVRDFEDSFVLVEMVACFPGETADPGPTLTLYTEPAFRMEASSRIREIVEEGDLSCIYTDGVPVLLDPTRACNRITEMRTPEVAAQHSQVVTSRTDGGFQAVYFKESLKTFVRTADGLALHYVNYTRSGGLGGMKKRLGRGKIADSQREQVDLLREKLRAAEPSR